MKKRAGGCLCGTVRYELKSEPSDAGWCHCRTCQLNSGSPAMAFATVPAGDFRCDQGEDRVASFESSKFGRRYFCGSCGTPLYVQMTSQPDTLDFSLATLDEPDAVVPGFHIFYASRIAWAPAGDALPRYDRLRSDTPGPKNG